VTFGILREVLTKAPGGVRKFAVLSCPFPSLCSYEKLRKAHSVSSCILSRPPVFVLQSGAGVRLSAMSKNDSC
jgi:hypothetical protein